MVLPHEDVMPGPVADRAALMRATRANLEPLLLAYRDGDATAAVVERTADDREPLLATDHRGRRPPPPVGAHRPGRHRRRRRRSGHPPGTDRRRPPPLGHLPRLQAAHPPGTPWDHGLVLLVDTARHPLRVRAIHRVLHRLPLDRALDTARPSSGYARCPATPSTPPWPRSPEAAADGNAFVLAGDGGFHLLDRPDPAPLDAHVPADRPRHGAAWTPPSCTRLLLDHVWRIPDSPDDIRYIHAADGRRRTGGTARGHGGADAPGARATSSWTWPGRAS